MGAQLVHLRSMVAEQDHRMVQAVLAHGGRLRQFLRGRVPARQDIEDILQDVWLSLLESFRLSEPIEDIGAWLLTVARHRIIDRFRRKQHAPVLEADLAAGANADEPGWRELLPSPLAGPDAALAREWLGRELAAAIDELPPAQAEVFIQHELLGKSFKDLATATGIAQNTLLARKHAAVKFLRIRLEAVRAEL
jgi:RNA polymerase sigma factor (sigma-70 family)